MSIASRIQEIETHIGDVYDTINYSYDTTGINKNIINIPKYLKKGYIDIINNGIDTLYNNFPKVSGIGSNLSLTPTYEAPMKLNEIQGDTLQDGTPTPDTPVEIQSVTGLQNVNVCGKNLITTYNYASSGYINYNYDNSKIGKTMTYSFIPNFSTTNASLYIRANTSISSYKVGTIATITSGTKVSVTFTLTDEQYNTIKNTTGGYIQVYKSGVSMDENSISNPMLEINNQATEYEPYKGNTYEVNLGKNLFDINGTFTGNPIKYNNGFQLIKNSTNRTINYLPSSPIPKGTYTLSYEIVSSTLSDVNKLLIQFFNADNTNILTKTLSSTGSLNCILTEDVTKIYFYISNTETDDTQITLDNIQLEKGSTSTSFSPYFTPIELNKIGDYQDSIKKSNGKNLFDINGTVTQGTLDKYNNGFTLVKGTNRVIRFVLPKVLPAGTYTLSYDTINVENVSGNYFYVSCQYTNTNIGILNNIILNDSGATFTTTGEFDRLYFFIAGNQSNDATITIDNVQLEQNNQATDYEPYGKVWYVEKNIGKVVLNGSESGWSYNVVNQVFIVPDLVNYLRSGFVPYSNYYQGQSVTLYNQVETNHIAFLQSTTQSRLLIKNLNYTGVDAFKTWLSTHNTEVLYVLATPTYTEITNTELIEDLETLYTAKSQDGTTNISITSEDLEMILNVSALKGDA